MEAMIIGGGVAGPVTALALRRIGWNVTIHEAYTDPAGDVGSFVSLGANGLRALDAIGAGDAVTARGTAIPLLRLWSGRGRLLGEAPRGRVTLMRGHLVETLRDLAIDAGARLVTGRRLQDVRNGVATFADNTRTAGDSRTTSRETGQPGSGHRHVGQPATADLIVGADGVHSRMRTIVDPDAPAPVYAGLWIISGRSTHPVEPGAFNLMLGSKATFVYTATAAGTLWSAQVPARTRPAASLDHESLLELYHGDRGPAARIIEHTDQWHPFTVLRRLPSAPRSHRDAMVLLGDAAHPIGAGQGASLAIEDAVVLAKCLRDRATVTDALAAFDRLRRPRTDRMLKATGVNSDAKIAGPLAARVRDVLMPVLFRRFAARGSAWMYDYDVEWQTPVTTAPA
ncbi:FAD-dependent monooxygenase [Dactylosporangium fulvum]|uniref:FAD-dependent monooxygenase n=1 Tax=Dactylosporangium fulvum TaxID=53359 RepID=A0ABY5VZW7_9ACTN|nr:NAD(P)/FAD-dependent oxidoreductase [Dactylosporangium fulvum]UWP81326.1 FAD-dependent monooxygenase [Dactylosporangium fulvum]